VLVDSAVDSDSQQIVCVHSAPFTAVAEPDSRVRPAHLNATIYRVPARVPLSEPAGADVRVYDAAGREVRRLAAGCGRWWDGSDRTGRAVGTGIYLLVTDKSSTPVIVLR
jgi:hypothetical protein